MANPGYPMQPPPMQQPPMGGPPMGGPAPAVAPPKPVKQGTSKIVPVIVSAGLAIGTFCGLLFGLGTGEPAAAEPSTGNNVKPSEDTTTTPTTSTTPAKTEPAKTEAAKTEPAKTEAAKTEAAKTEPAKTETAAAGTGSGSAAPAADAKTAETKPAGAGSGSGDTKTAAAPTNGSAATPAKGGTTPPAEPAVKKPKLTVELSPATVAATAKITVDGKAIEGNSVEIDLGKEPKKEVKIVVKASGYKTVEQKVDVDSDVAVKIELIKRASTPVTGPRPGGNTNPGNGKKKNPPGGGLIDI